MSSDTDKMIRIDSETWRELRRRAVEHDRTIKEEVRRLVARTRPKRAAAG